MERDSLSADDAVLILFGYQAEYSDFDPSDPDTYFSSGADVCEALAAHFGFTDEDYKAASRRLVRRRQYRERKLERARAGG